MPDNPKKLSQFWQELKRRRVVRVIIVYGTAALVIIELVDIIRSPLLLPEWKLTLVIVLLAIGFPIAFIFSWIFDITPKGIRKTKPIKLAKGQRNNYPLSDKISHFENSIAVLPWLKVDPAFNNLKDDDHFRDLYERTGHKAYDDYMASSLK